MHREERYKIGLRREVCKAKLVHLLRLNKIEYTWETGSFVYLFKMFLNVYFLRERERETTSREGAERGGDTESEAGCRLRAVSTEPDAGLEPTNSEIMT